MADPAGSLQRPRSPSWTKGKGKEGRVREEGSGGKGKGGRGAEGKKTL